KVKDMAKEMSDKAGGQKPDPQAAAKAEAEKKEIEQAAKDMQSGDPDMAKAGREKLEQKFGKDAVDKAEKEAKQLQKDLQSQDPKTREAAEKKLENMSGGKEAMDQAKKDAEQMAKDLKSDDPKTREAAEQKLKDMADKAKGGDDKTAKQDGSKPEKKTE